MFLPQRSTNGHEGHAADWLYREGARRCTKAMRRIGFTTKAHWATKCHEEARSPAAESLSPSATKKPRSPAAEYDCNDCQYDASGDHCALSCDGEGKFSWRFDVFRKVSHILRLGKACRCRRVTRRALKRHTMCRWRVTRVWTRGVSRVRARASRHTVQSRFLLSLCQFREG